MTDLENQNINPEIQDQESTDYIDAINELKNNSVPKDKYERVLAENKKLLKSLTSNVPDELQGMAPKKPDIKEAIQPLADRNNHMLSLEFAEASLAYREAVIANGGRDPYLPQGDGANLTAKDYEDAKAMELALKHCIEVADGDSAVFTNEWNRIYVPNPMNQAIRRK